MTQRKPLPSVVKFNRLLNAVTNMNHYSCSIDLFKQMCVNRVPFDAYTMNIVIKCCSQLNHTNHGFAVLGYGLKHAVSPDVCTFNTLLNGLVREDRILKAELLFKKLSKQEVCEPDVVMYSTMIKGLCKFGNNVIAISLLGLMDESGLDEALSLFRSIGDKKDMDERGFSLDATSLSLLLDHIGAKSLDASTLLVSTKI
ncbi:hypothetical protein L1987_32159 [Smallanthus sonchifolius]|uniref:Uncharacterized protein n=1 Tax=Smallanthus sonchifolius TaxID=185202 RepID=A0ACB9I7E2_9ASTR|nr:hypothetical protein L1987_32159 [Smallanthus sonchifolius]